MAKQILSGTTARNSIKTGIDSLADTVKTGLGPKGRSTVLNRIFDRSVITKAGAKIAKDIVLQRGQYTTLTDRSQ